MALQVKQGSKCEFVGREDAGSQRRGASRDGVASILLVESAYREKLEIRSWLGSYFVARVLIDMAGGFFVRDRQGIALCVETPAAVMKDERHTRGGTEHQWRHSFSALLLLHRKTWAKQRAASRYIPFVEHHHHRRGLLAVQFLDEKSGVAWSRD